MSQHAGSDDDGTNDASEEDDPDELGAPPQPLRLPRQHLRQRQQHENEDGKDERVEETEDQECKYTSVSIPSHLTPEFLSRPSSNFGDRHLLLRSASANGRLESTLTEEDDHRPDTLRTPLIADQRWRGNRDFRSMDHR